MTRQFTPEQETITFYPGSVSIDAGAGSGKTFVLTQRILQLLSGGLGAQELAAVTFTEAAAAELRSRLQALLDQEAARTGSETVLAAARALPLAQISTIHALCARIIREHPVESGAGLRFTVLDEAEAKTWLERQLPEVLAELPAGDFGELPAETALEAVSLMLADPHRAEAALRQSLAYQEAEQRRLEEAVAQEAADKDRIWAESLEVLRTYAATTPDDALEVGRRAALQAAEVTGSVEVRWAAMRDALRGVRKKAGSAAAWLGHKPAVSAAIENLRQITRPSALEHQLWQCRALPVLERLYLHAQAALDTRKQTEEILTFADLERLAARALAEPQVREYYAQRWKALLVDEFQDTSPLQWEILSALSEHGLNLTVVGDEKQSIYAFRGADVTLFREARERIREQGGAARALTTSFRTHRDLVEVVNAFFAAYMPGPSGPESTAATFTPLTAHRQESPHPSAPCELHVVGGATQKPPLQAAEARLIAHRIATLLTEGRTVGGRPLSYGDIAVLLRTRTHLATYEQALFQAGIPYTVQGGTGLLKRPEVRDLCQLLFFLANPADDLALASVLRSPLCHWPDERLVTLTSQRERERSLWAQLGEQAPALLQQLMEARRFKPASALLTLALEHSDFAPVMASLPDGPRRLANIDALFSLLHSYAQEGHGDVGQVSRKLKDSLRLELPVPEATLGSDDAVQIMTVHGSKGLEFPVVILPDLLTQGRGDSPGLLMHPQLGLSLKVPGLKSGEHPAAHQAILSRLEEQRDAEDERIRYVALTRAADLLIMTAGVKPSEESKLSELSRLLPEENVLRFHYLAADIPAPERGHWRPDGAVYTTAAVTGQALPETLPVTSIGLYRQCPRAFEFRYVLGRPPFTPLWEPELQRREGSLSGAVIGSAVHQAIELGLSPAGVQGRFPHLSLQERTEVAQLVGNLELPAFAALKDAEPQREVPVTYQVDGLTFEGVIDALYDDWVVDYKTDRYANPHEHLSQLALYTEATGARRASLAYLRHNTLYDCTAEELSLTRRLNDKVFEGILAHQFAPTPSPSTCRFCSFKRVCSAAMES